MHTGLLWFDDDPEAALSVRVQKAAEYYFKKFGRAPEICLVPPALLEKGQSHAKIGALTVCAYRPLAPRHFWIGVEEKK